MAWNVWSDRAGMFMLGMSVSTKEEAERHRKYYSDGTPELNRKRKEHSNAPPLPDDYVVRETDRIMTF